MAPLLPSKKRKPCVSKWKLRLKPRLPPLRRSRSVLNKKPAARRRRMPSVVVRKKRDSASKRKKPSVKPRQWKSKTVFARCTTNNAVCRSRSVTSS